MVKQLQFYPSLLLISLMGPGHAPLLYAQDANNVHARLAAICANLRRCRRLLFRQTTTEFHFNFYCTCQQALNMRGRSVSVTASLPTLDKVA